MSVLFSMRGTMEALTAAATGELAPVIEIEAGSLRAGMILRGRLSGKTVTPDTPDPEALPTARLRLSMSPRNWAPNARYVVGDLVRADTDKQYVCMGPDYWQPSTAYKLNDEVRGKSDVVYKCVTAGTSSTVPPSGILGVTDGTAVWDYVAASPISATTGGPTGRGKKIVDLATVWDYSAENPIILDSGDMQLVNDGHDVGTWILDFDIDVMDAGASGIIICTGKYTAANLANKQAVPLPVDGPTRIYVDTTKVNALHITYTPEFPTCSITCLTYVLEEIR